MSDKLSEVFEKAIPVHEQALKELPEDYREAKIYLNEKELDVGICWWAANLFGINICNEMKKNTPQVLFLERQYDALQPSKYAKPCNSALTS